MAYAKKCDIMNEQNERKIHIAGNVQDYVTS